MNLTAYLLELRVVMCCQGRISFLLVLPDLGLHLRFVDPSHIVMAVGLDMERSAKRLEQVRLVHLGMALQRFMVDTLGNFPKFRHSFLFEFFKRMGHRLSSPFLGRNFTSGV